jgi:hypothetical protein
MAPCFAIDLLTPLGSKTAQHVVKLGLAGIAFKFACQFGISGAAERHELNEDKWLDGRVLRDLLICPHVSRLCKQSVATVEEKP